MSKERRKIEPPFPSCGICGAGMRHPKEGKWENSNQYDWLVCSRCDLIPVFVKESGG